MAFAIHVIGIDLLAAMVVPADLESRHAENRKSVEVPLGRLEIEDREHVWPEALGAAWLGPEEHLPFRTGQRRKRREHHACP